MATLAAIRTLVLVEGESDAAAVRALAALMGRDLGLHQIQIWPASGVTNFSKVLVDFVRTHPGAELCGMYDVADEWHVRRALTNAAVPIAAHESLESFGFFACVADLERHERSAPHSVSSKPWTLLDCRTHSRNWLPG